MASFFLSLLVLSLLLPSTTTTTTALTTATLTSAAEILSDTTLSTTFSFTAMSLTLPLLSSILLPLPSATLFSPPDSSFLSLPFSSGQPPLSLLLLHFSPLHLPSLPPSSSSLLPSLLPLQSLSLSSSSSLNGVSLLSPLPLFDDGNFSVFALDRFLNPTQLACSSPSVPYGGASAALRSKGYSYTASFLDLQLDRFSSTSPITVFAPKDQLLEGRMGNFTDSVSLFLRHVVPCDVPWSDLNGFGDSDGDESTERSVRTFLDGFVISVTRSGGGDLMLNGEVVVDSPELYRDDRVLVHGLAGVLAGPEREDYDGASGGGGGRDAYPPVSNVMYDGEF